MTVGANRDKPVFACRGVEQAGEVDAAQICVVRRKRERESVLRVVEDLLHFREHITSARHFHVVEPSRAFAAWASQGRPFSLVPKLPLGNVYPRSSASPSANIVTNLPQREPTFAASCCSASMGSR